MIRSLIDFILHIDVHLQSLIAQYGTTIYAILFLIIFIETGLVIMPFLPGDSLLFAAGSFAWFGSLNIRIVLITCSIAAIVWDTLNYFIGNKFGKSITKIYVWWYQLVKPKYIEQTELFFQKHGKQSIIIARFMPIVRTFAPFVAGIGKMNYSTFLSYNIIGGLVRVWGIVGVGYFFGQHPRVKANFEKVVIGIIIISLLPMIWHALVPRLLKKR